jgi:2-polyprenyl-3-methyl-5-hydroxy-6-metoxy-1,4-benzoquinol methylase
MTKGDFLLKDGKITLQYLPRILPEDVRFGKGYAERTKNIGRYFKSQFMQLSDKTEQTGYFKERLAYNYLYKGPVLEWYLRVKLRLEKNYQPFHELLPKQGKLLDMGCGYGFMSYMLHFVSPQRDITGIDYDEEKIETANNCFDKKGNINFKFVDALEYPFENYDGIIVADMLHYLQPGQQKLMIEKCIRHLNPGGIILIREGNTDLEKKHKGTRITEFFSTRLTGFNQTGNKGLSFMSGTLIKKIANEQKMECTEIDHTKYTSNIVFVLKHEQVN